MNRACPQVGEDQSAVETLLALNAAKCLSVSPVNRPPQRFIGSESGRRSGEWGGACNVFIPTPTPHSPFPTQLVFPLRDFESA